MESIQNWFVFLVSMKYRTSYGQNALKHSIEVAQLSGLLSGRDRAEDVRIGKESRSYYMISVKLIDHEMEGFTCSDWCRPCVENTKSRLLLLMR